MNSISKPLFFSGSAQLPAVIAGQAVNIQVGNPVAHDNVLLGAANDFAVFNDVLALRDGRNGNFMARRNLLGGCYGAKLRPLEIVYFLPGGSAVNNGDHVVVCMKHNCVCFHMSPPILFKCTVMLSFLLP